MAKKALGKGLSSIFEEMGTPVMNMENGDLVHEIKLSEIKPNPFQPRRIFKDEEILELSNSIQKNGLLQPILLRKQKDNFQIIAGERRFKSVKKLGFKTIKAYIRKNVSDRDMIELSLIENIQRVQLLPLEEARAFSKLIQECGLTHEELAKKLSKSRSSITNTLRLLNLDKKVQSYLNEGRITAGHARAILQFPAADHVSLAEKILVDNLSVRKSESLSINRKPPPSQKIDPNLSALLDKIKFSLGCRISLKGDENKGKLEISYSSKDELEKISLIINSGSHYHS